MSYSPLKSSASGGILGIFGGSPTSGPQQPVDPSLLYLLTSVILGTCVTCMGIYGLDNKSNK